MCQIGKLEISKKINKKIVAKDIRIREMYTK